MTYNRFGIFDRVHGILLAMRNSLLIFVADRLVHGTILKRTFRPCDSRLDTTSLDNNHLDTKWFQLKTKGIAVLLQSSLAGVVGTAEDVWSSPKLAVASRK